MPQSNGTIDTSRISVKGLTLSLEADAKTLARIAEDTDAESVESCTAEVVLRTWKTVGVKIEAELAAKLTQNCVATFEPIVSDLVVAFERRFLPEDHKLLQQMNFLDGELVIDPDQDDEPEPLTGKTIDLWAIIVEELNLIIDPFPRVEGLEFEENPEEPSPEENDTHAPFANLGEMLAEKKSKS